MNRDRPPLSRTLHGQLYLLTLCIIVLWLTEAVDQVLFGGHLDRQGIHPRDTEHLVGVLWAPFLHGGFAHLAANTIPFLVLGWFVLLRGAFDFVAVSAATALGSGAMAWFLGTPGEVHVGASGVIFGYLGFLLARALVEHSLVTLVVALAAAFLYGGLVWGVLPGAAGISWQGHLGGFLAGAGLAWLLPVHTREKAAR